MAILGGIPVLRLAVKLHGTQIWLGQKSPIFWRVAQAPRYLLFNHQMAEGTRYFCENSRLWHLTYLGHERILKWSHLYHTSVKKQACGHVTINRSLKCWATYTDFYIFLVWEVVVPTYDGLILIEQLWSVLRDQMLICKIEEK